MKYTLLALLFAAACGDNLDPVVDNGADGLGAATVRTDRVEPPSAVAPTPDAHTPDAGVPDAGVATPDAEVHCVDAPPPPVDANTDPNTEVDAGVDVNVDHTDVNVSAPVRGI